MSFGKDHTGQGHGHIDHPAVDNPVVVPAGVDIANSTPSGHCSLQGPSVFTTTPTRGAPTTQEAVTSGRAFIRDALQGFGLSPSASALIQESWRPGTRVQYYSLLRGWQGFCSQWKVHPLSPTIFDVISYLTSMYDRGLQYTTIASARSVLCPPYSGSYINFFASSYNTAVEGNLSCPSPQTSV